MEGGRGGSVGEGRRRARWLTAGFGRGAGASTVVSCCVVFHDAARRCHPRLSSFEEQSSRRDGRRAWAWAGRPCQGRAARLCADGAKPAHTVGMDVADTAQDGDGPRAESGWTATRGGERRGGGGVSAHRGKRGLADGEAAFSPRSASLSAGRSRSCGRRRARWRSGRPAAGRRSARLMP